MSLLAFKDVRLADPVDPERELLGDISLQLEAGEMVCILGKRRSGRSSLLRLACGLLLPDGGEVRFEGQPLRAPAIGDGIAFCAGISQIGEAWPVARELTEVQLARGISRRAAQARAQSTLERTGATPLSERLMRSLRGSDQVRVMLALALTGEPRLLIVDDVIASVPLTERMAIMRLLRSLADEGLAVLTSTDETPGLAGADRALMLSGGRLHGRLAPQVAEVLPLRASSGG